MTHRELDKQLEKLKLTIKNEKETLFLYEQNVEEISRSYNRAVGKFKIQQKKVEDKIDRYYYELRKLIKS